MYSLREQFWNNTQDPLRQVFGLDSHYKSTIYRFPLWVLTTVSNDQHGSVGYVVIANRGTKRLLSMALRCIFQNILDEIRRGVVKNQII